jgi:protoporphyrinogen IX oxidase
MEYNYLKAIHIVFVVTWFAGLFYMPRLFIYHTEANDQEQAARDVLQSQFNIMMRRLWFGITWPSAVITLVIGVWVLFNGGWGTALVSGNAGWLLIKLILVVLLYLYHFSLHYIYKKLSRKQFPYTSDQLRMWNEVATIFLITIVMLATVKQSFSFVWGILGTLALILVLLLAIRVYKKIRS